MTDPIAIIERRLAKIVAAIERLRAGMQTGRDIDAAAAQLHRAQCHREILIDVMREIKSKK